MSRSAASDWTGMDLGRLLLVGIACYAATRFAPVMPGDALPATPIALSEAIAVAAFHRIGHRCWPAVLVAAFLAHLHAGMAPPLAAWVALGGTAGSLSTVVMLAKLRFDAAFERVRDVGAYCAAGFAGMALPATAGVAAQLLSRDIGATQVSSGWFNGYLCAVTGLLLVGPLLLSIGKRRRAPRTLGRIEIAVGCVLLAAVAIAWPLVAHLGGAVVALLLLPIIVVVCSALRFDPTIAAGSTLAIAAAVAWLDLTGWAPFRTADPAATLRTFWLYFTLLAVLGMLLAALRAELAAAALATRESERRYEDLFRLVPLPLAVLDRATGRFLAVNDATVAAYGYSREEFLRMESRDIALDADVEPFRLFDRAEPVVGVLRRHRLRDGRVIAVEMSGHGVDYNGAAAVVTIARDISDEQRIDRAVLEAGMRERRHLSEQLHDGLGQDITGLSLLASGLVLAARRDGLSIAPDLEHLAEIARHAVSTCRDIARGLSPLSEMHGGLAQALADMIERMRDPQGPAIALRLEEDPAVLARLPAEVANHLFGIAQEALTNALKHANARQVAIVLERGPAGLVLAVRDDGSGLVRADPGRSGLGLRMMRHRAASLGARLRVLGEPGAGTTVTCEWLASSPDGARALTVAG